MWGKQALPHPTLLNIQKAWEPLVTKCDSKIRSRAESEGADQGLGIARHACHSDFKQGFKCISFPACSKKKILFRLIMKEHTLVTAGSGTLGEEQRQEF